MSYLEELLPEFRKGAKIRLNNWQEDEYIFMNDTLAKDSNGYAFNFNLKHLFCDNWEFYKKPDPDWDYIIKNKCLCWFWDDDGDKPVNCAGLIEMASRRFLGFRAENGSCWRYCRPVRRDEVTFYEDKEND